MVVTKEGGENYGENPEIKWVQTADGKVQVEEEEDPDRPQWSSRLDFLLSCIGYAVGLGNVWRFPYLCYKNGGGAFLIPYFTIMILAGIPLFFLEVALGQFTSRGAIRCWKICPIFQGIGFATTLIMFYCNLYYVIILAWALYYMGMSFSKILPWSHCNNEWNTEYCTDLKTDNTIPTNDSIFTNYTENATNISPENLVTSAEEFWKYKALDISEGLHDIGTVRWELAICLIVAWIVVYFCIFKGVKVTGKVVYFTATFPYVMITILLIRGVTLPGAGKGISFYLTPDISKLADGQVWYDAGTQIFYSYAIGFGTLTSLGSYNKYHNNCYQDSIIIACVNSGTSLFAGFAIFSILGYMAHTLGVEVENVVESGPGLAFIAYPMAVSLMPLSQFWAICFFFMLILLGLDSEFVEVEGFVTAISDLFPKFMRKGRNREHFVLGTCIFSFFIGLFMITNGGIYVFELFNYYSASGMVLLCMAFFECVAIAWVYGVKRYEKNIKHMIGYFPFVGFKLSWFAVTPFLTLGIWIFSIITWVPLTYGSYEYPKWGEAIGLLLALSSMICIPLVFIQKLLMAEGNLGERWRQVTTPIFKAHQIEGYNDSKDIIMADIKDFEKGSNDKPPPYL